MSQLRVLIYLLRRDLRLADNPVFSCLSQKIKESSCEFTHLLPVYVFPASSIEISGFLALEGGKCPFPQARSEVGRFWRCGPHRVKFLAESVWDLKQQLQDHSSDLQIHVGALDTVVGSLIDRYERVDSCEVCAVWMTNEEGVEEQREQRSVGRAVQRRDKSFKLWTDEKYFIDE